MMEDVLGRRARKPVNYAEMADSINDDHDFADFKTSSSSKTGKVNDRKENVDGKEKDDKERKHSKDRHRDHKKHKDKDRHREDKDRHRKDKDKHREDRDRHRKRDARERDERKRREHKDRENRSEKKDNSYSQDSTKTEGSSGTTSDSSGSQTLHDSPATNTTLPASPLVSPSRRNPKPRLSLEEKVFQRELEVVLELSKEESSQASSKTPEPEKQLVTEGGITLDEKQETEPPSSPTYSQKHSSEGGCSISTKKTEVLVEGSPLAPEKPSALESVEEEEKEVEQTPDPTPPPAVANCTDTMEPLPSTSAGKTAKRIRKTVMFKEDSDSDGFDGFGYDVGAESEASEGSDFMPSPKKKKKSKETKKAKNTKPDKNSTQKSSNKSTHQNKAGDVPSSPKSHPVLAKENTAPKNVATPPPAKSTLVSPMITTSPELKASSKSHTPPPTKAATKKTSAAKPVKRSLISTPSSTSSGAPSIALVKTQFRSPLSTSPNSGFCGGSPANSVGTKTLYRGTGLRLGLSRRANLKPLHPSIGRITN